MEKITSHREFKVYLKAFKAAREIDQLSNAFPKEESYALTNQIGGSSRPVCANIAEAFGRRNYPFSNKLKESEAEAAEPQNWLNFALDCEYLSENDFSLPGTEYENIIGMLVNMQKQPENGLSGLILKTHTPNNRHSTSSAYIVNAQSPVPDIQWL
nr:four helix bundle protein [Sunxiuqinia sp.]